MMNKLITVVISILCGVGQFFILRQTLKPISKGESPQTVLFMLLKLPVPLALLGGCALIDTGLLPFAGIAFCAALMVSSVVNHLVTMKKEKKEAEE